MKKTLTEIEKHEQVFDKEMEGIVKWTLCLLPEERVGYLHVSLKERHIQLRLKRRIAHFQENYELCAAVNRHIAKILPFLEKCKEYE